MKKILKITLKSDICIGSGYSYAGIVDADACFDRFGIPYIPARRIKGCLREAAELIGEDTSIFGEWGQSSAKDDTPVYIRNAYVKDYAKIANELERLSVQKNVSERKRKNQPQDLALKCFLPEHIRECYSRIKAQTAIDEESGVAKETSLRFTRIVNRYDPMNGEELTFFAEIDLRDGDDRSVAILEKAAKALRHMGENRTRGLGNVRCTLVESDDLCEDDNSAADDKKLFSEVREKMADGTENVTLLYTIRTDAPVVISNDNEQESETYISGRSVLGFFANAYLRQSRNGADATFEDLFLKDRVLFSPLYPSSADGEIYFPAPVWINRLKKFGVYVNVSRDWPKKEDERYGENREHGKYYPFNGNQPKKLTGKFVLYDSRDKKVDVHEVEKELIYHHRHERDAMDEQLYALNAISAGQYFSGMITGKAEDVKVMEDILRTTPVRLGKSRSAQYGKCSVVPCKKNPKSRRLHCKSGDKLLVTLQSDGLFVTDDMENAGNYTVRIEEVRKQIKNSLEKAVVASKKKSSKNKNVAVEEAFFDDSNDAYGEIEVKQLSGHYGVWNLRRTSIPCVCAGTTLEFRVRRELDFRTDIVLTGVRNGEGFGRLSAEKKLENWCVDEKTPNSRLEECTVSDMLQPLYRRSLRAELFEEMEKKALKEVKKSGLTASAIGRLTLMLTESVNESGGDPQETRKKLDDKMDSIKDKAKKEEARQFVKKHYDNALENTGYRKLLAQVADKDKLENECKLHCLKQALVILKYQTKEEN